MDRFRSYIFIFVVFCVFLGTKSTLQAQTPPIINTLLETHQKFAHLKNQELFGPHNGFNANELANLQNQLDHEKTLVFTGTEELRLNSATVDQLLKYLLENPEYKNNRLKQNPEEKKMSLSFFRTGGMGFLIEAVIFSCATTLTEEQVKKFAEYLFNSYRNENGDLEINFNKFFYEDMKALFEKLPPGNTDPAFVLGKDKPGDPGYLQNIVGKINNINLLNGKEIGKLQEEIANTEKKEECQGCPPNTIASVTSQSGSRQPEPTPSPLIVSAPHGQVSFETPLKPLYQKRARLNSSLVELKQKLQTLFDQAVQSLDKKAETQYHERLASLNSNIATLFFYFFEELHDSYVKDANNELQYAKALNQLSESFPASTRQNIKTIQEQIENGEKELQITDAQIFSLESAQSTP